MSRPSARLPLRGSHGVTAALPGPREGSRAHSSKWGSKLCLQRREAPAPALWGIGVAHTRGRNCGLLWHLCGPSTARPTRDDPISEYCHFPRSVQPGQTQRDGTSRRGQSSRQGCTMPP